jgi:NAD(P)-dependent dehydrogenase (short-subunit alcohol dehydrogenase family)
MTTTAVSFGGAAVVVTGGTRGLGRALGLEFSRAGASVYLTHRWGSADEAEVSAEFEREGLAAPRIIESDASDPDDARALMREVGRHEAPLIAIVSNLAFGQIVSDMRELNRPTLELSLRYSTWPILDLLRAAKETLGRYPRYALAISTDGGAVCHPGYDAVGIAKAALESLCRYLALHLRGEGVRVNAVRCGPLDTASSRATFGDLLLDSEIAAREGLLLDPRSVGRACVALCSGLMDSVTGQVITVDEGVSLLSPIHYLTEESWPGPFPARDPEADP